MRKFFGYISSILDFINKYFKTFVFLVIVIFLISLFSDDTTSKSPNLAKIYLQGPIISSDSIRNQIEKIKSNSGIKGVLLLIDSPGGSMSASVEISDMIAELKQKMPVVAYVKGIMASGSYYGGMYADKIYANRGALIGSIGVIFSGVDIKGLMDKIGIKEQGIAAGEYKEMGTFTRQWNPKEKEYMQNLIQEEYHMFISDVALARGLDVKNYHQYAEGKVFSAKNALKLGLIDVIGTQDEAIDMLKNLAQVSDPVWLKKDILDNYIDRFAKSSTQMLLQTLDYKLH